VDNKTFSCRLSQSDKFSAAAPVYFIERRGVRSAKIHHASAREALFSHCEIYMRPLCSEPYRNIIIKLDSSRYLRINSRASINLAHSLTTPLRKAKRKNLLSAHIYHCRSHKNELEHHREDITKYSRAGELSIYQETKDQRPPHFFIIVVRMDKNDVQMLSSAVLSVGSLHSIYVFILSVDFFANKNMSQLAGEA
jgi:hypothetical protein